MWNDVKRRTATASAPPLSHTHRLVSWDQRLHRAALHDQPHTATRTHSNPQLEPLSHSHSPSNPLHHQSTMANDPSKEQKVDDSATAILRPKKSCVARVPSLIAGPLR